MTFAQPKKKHLVEWDIERDRHRRPLITPPDGGEKVPYTRVSTMAKVLEDTSRLEDWKMRNVAIGMARRDDLVGIATAAPHDKQRMNDVVKDALAAAESNAAANRGTGMHAWTELVDDARREGRPTAPVIASAPENLRRHLIAYEEATRNLRPVAIEQFVVTDEVRCAGTLDRLVDYNGRVIVADLKTGKDAHKYVHATAVQEAIYAHGAIYDPKTENRWPLKQVVDVTMGLLIHLPWELEDGEEPHCDLYQLDLVAGWQAAQVSHWVHGEWRKRNDLARRWYA